MSSQLERTFPELVQLFTNERKALMYKDFKEIGRKYDQAESYASQLGASLRGDRFKRVTGVSIKVIRINTPLVNRNRPVDVFMDARLKPEETNLEEVKQRLNNVNLNEI